MPLCHVKIVLHSDSQCESVRYISHHLFLNSHLVIDFYHCPETQSHYGIPAAPMYIGYPQMYHGYVSQCYLEFIDIHPTLEELQLHYKNTGRITFHNL